MKGQYFSFDAIIGSVIFVLALVALLSYWYSVRSFLDYQNDPLSKEAIKISNLLFTPAAPSSSCGTMDKFGMALSWDDRRIDYNILNCSRTQTTSWLKEKLGTQYNASIKVTNMADATNITLGGDVPATASNVVKIRRAATVVNPDGTDYAATVDLSLYR